MRIRYPYALPAVLLALLLVACREDEPKGGIKPIAERTVLTIDETGNVYNINGELITKLPDCEEVTQIITDGDDYFVSGVNSKMKVGYWKNGKWNTLHVDFIDDIDHWAFGIGRDGVWRSYGDTEAFALDGGDRIRHRARTIVAQRQHRQQLFLLLRVKLVGKCRLVFRHRHASTHNS